MTSTVMTFTVNNCADCGGRVPFAAVRCRVCAHDRVEASMWWTTFRASWHFIGWATAVYSQGAEVDLREVAERLREAF